VGEHRHQGPGALRCPPRRGARRPGRRQHHARGHAARVADHGDTGRTLEWRSGTAGETLRRAEAAGPELDGVAARLERAGVQSFCASSDDTRRSIAAKVARRDDRLAEERWVGEGGHRAAPDVLDREAAAASS